jgi:EAL and modified HD-GYP domain-containing signal transduction protein
MKMATYPVLNCEKEEEEPVSNLAEPLVEVTPPTNAFLVRQPVFDKDMEVYAYDLLYGQREQGGSADNVESSQVMLNAFLDIGIETISEDSFSIVKVTKDFVEGKLPLPFPPHNVFLELPDDVFKPDMSLEPLEKLRVKGFKLACANVDSLADIEGVLAHVDLLRLDFSAWTKEQLALSIPQLLSYSAKLLVININTQDDFSYCLDLGVELYQGRFISEPVVVSGNTLKPNRMSLLSVLKELEDPDCDISVLEDLISQDVTLSYKILRIINSAFYGFRRKIDSVKQAVVSLGLTVIRDWFIIISLTNIDDKPQSLMFQTLQRARMMQLLADVMGVNKDTGFTVGLFSSIDAIMDQPMEAVLKALPLSHEITEALMEREGVFGELLNIVVHYEEGDWKYINSIGFETSELSTYYFESMLWTRELFEQIKND